MKPLCVAPWTSLIINGSNYNCCCYLSMQSEGLEFPSSRADVMRIFNSDGFKELRQRLLKGDVKGTGCDVCIQRRGAGLAQIGARADAPEAVVQAAKDSISRGDIEVDYTPFTISLNSSTECNLRCIMCYNSDLPEQRIKNSLVPYKKFIAAIEDIGFDNIQSLSVVGGEPFMTEDALETFRYIANDPNGGTHVSANTNGTLLHNHWDLIKSFSSLRLEFSIDAYGENYEKIRRGGSWERMLKNFKAYSEIVAERPLFDVGINVVVMMSSITDMGKILRLGAEHGAKVRFSPIVGNYFDENFFQFPELLNNVEWEPCFEEAIAQADQTDKEAAVMLRKIRNDLSKRMASKEKLVVDGGCEPVMAYQREVLGNLPQQKIAFLGASAELMSLVGSLDGEFCKDIIVADFELQDVERNYLGKPIVSLQDVPATAEIGVISAKSYKYLKYKNWFDKHFPSFPVVVMPYWEKNLYENIGRLSQEVRDTPVVLFATGGTADVLLDTTELGDLNFVICSDNNKDKWGTQFQGMEIVPPADILKYAKDVVVCSDFYTKAIKESLEELHGDAINVHTIF